MRDHGVDMPDPEFSDDGGVRIGGPARRAAPTRPDSDEFEAADDGAAARSLEEAMPEPPQLDPEEVAELQ